MAIGVNADITANVKSWVQGMREAVDAAATLGKGVKGLEKDVKTFVREEKGESRMGSFIGGELQKLLPLSKEVSSALGGVAGAFVMGGGIAGAAFELAKVGVESLSNYLRESSKAAEELDRKRLEGLTASVDRLKEGVQTARDKFLELMGIDPNREVMLKSIITAKVALATYKQTLEDTVGTTDGFGNVVRLSAEELVAQGIASKSQIEQFNKLKAGAEEAEAVYAEYKKTVGDVTELQEAEALSERNFEEWKRRNRERDDDAKKSAEAEARYAKERDDLVLRYQTSAADERQKLEIQFRADLAKIRANDYAAQEALYFAHQERLNKIHLDAETRRYQNEQEDNKRAADLIKRGADDRAKKEKAASDVVKAAYDANLRDVQQYTSVAGSAMRTLASQVMQGHVDMAAIGKQAFTSLTNIVISEAERALSKWIATKMTEAAVSTATATTEVASNAAAAGSETAKQTASIPFVGPALAVAAGLAMTAAIMGAFAVASASGGYDIPSGVNPVVQAHAREMFLPEKYADVIRGMADDPDGGGTGGGTHYHNHWHGVWDEKGVTRFVESQEYRRANREARRNGRG